MVSREFPSNTFVQYHITAATPPSGLKHGSLKIAGSQRVQPTTDVECIFFPSSGPPVCFSFPALFPGGAAQDQRGVPSDKDGS